VGASGLRTAEQDSSNWVLQAVVTESQICKVLNGKASWKKTILQLVLVFLPKLRYWNLFIFASCRCPHLAESWLISVEAQVDRGAGLGREEGAW